MSEVTFIQEAPNAWVARQGGVTIGVIRTTEYDNGRKQEADFYGTKSVVPGLVGDREVSMTGYFPDAEPALSKLQKRILIAYGSGGDDA